MKDRKQRKGWIGWIYAAVLLLVAIVGVVYCVKLNRNTDATDNAQFYAVEENLPDGAGVLSGNADAGDSDATLTDGEPDLVDLGDISTEVPLGDVSE